MKHNRSLVTVVAVFFSGCASFSEKIDAWKGRTADELVVSWGPPTSMQEVAGGKALSYVHSHNIQGTSYDCRVWFITDKSNRIIRANGEGQIGGCNRFLGLKKIPSE